METILTYIVKVNIALAIFYLLYMLLFRKDTFIRMRRYYFLSAIIFSLSYPLVTVSVLGKLIDITPKTVVTETSVYIGEITMGQVIIDDTEEASTPINWLEIGKNVLLTGTLLLSVRLLWQLLSIIRLKSRSEKRSLFGYLFYHLKDEITPFSFFNWIFIHVESHSEKELKQILLHEQTHVCQWHSLDILLIEVLRIVFWWNPIVWLMKRDIAINLEYLADEAVLQEGIESTEYQYHLLQLTNHETAVQIVNNFNVSQLKQRIIMMNKNKSPMRKLAKYLSVLPLALLLITANSMHAQAIETQESSKEIAPPPPPPPPQKKESKSNEVFVVVEKQPEFPGGTSGLMKFLNENIEYPKEAQEKGIEGRVILSFIVEKDGGVADVQIVKGQDSLLDNEASRVISKMPNWTPGLQKNERVRVRYTLPIAFKLPEGVTESSAVGVKHKSKHSGNEVIVIGAGKTKDITQQSLAEKFGDSSPLIIVDGVKMKKDANIEDIDPTTIESISVLKDKTAITKYGDEGKNGVIEITTKSVDAKNAIKQKLAADKEDIFVVVEDQPQFKGGTEALMKYLGDNIKYPKEAHEKNIQGRVIANFVINKDGSISDVSIVRGVHSLLDAEAIRVISEMPNWKPGMQRGQAVRVRYTLPITFSLQGDKDEKKQTAETPDDIFVVVEQQPEFPGGPEALMKFIGENVRYPKESQENGVQGRVIVSFIVNKDGSLSDMEIVRGQDPLLDAEAIRIIATMPNWKPGMQRGKAVNVKYTLPITFRLEGDNEKAPFSLKEEGPIIGFTPSKENSAKYLKFLGENIKHPVIAQENGIMGFVKASYDVNSNGEVSNIKIVEGADPALDKELIRIIEDMPEDIALIRTGGKAASNINLSANFRLQSDERKLLESEKRESDIVVVGYGIPAK